MSSHTPTPPINIDAHERVTAEYWDDNCGFEPFSLRSSSLVDRRRLIRARPGGTNNRVRGTTWLNPSSYYHYYKYFNPNPFGDIDITYRGPCPIGHEGHSSSKNGSGWDSTVSDLPGCPSWMGDVAVTRAYTALKGSQVNLSVAFAERKETERLFTDAAEKIASQVRKFRKSCPRKKWELIKKSEGSKSRIERSKIPQDWLELQYGWKPLMSDVNGSCKALENNDKGTNRYMIRARGAVSNTYKKNWVKPWLPLPDNVFFEVTDTVKQSYKVMLAYQLISPLLASLASLGITNPLELIWERVPYSFVVDWFLPVGGWLSSFDADFGYEWKVGAITAISKVKSESLLRTIPYPTADIIVGTEAYFFEGCDFSRIVLNSPPGVGLPHFKSPFSSGHIANALALLVTAFR